ncbi:MAG: flippase, partial [Methanoregulaceae archaeon]|nr:flippase [Methanoregulaceae archaeon]
FFTTIYIAHNAGPAALGGFFLLLAYVGIIGLFTDGGISGAALQRISEGESRDEYFSAHAAVRVVLLAATLTILVAARSVFVDLNESGLFLWLLVALVVSVGAGIVSTGVYGSGKVGILQIADLVNNIIRVTVQVIAVYLGYSAGGLAAGLIAGIIAGLLINKRVLSMKFVKFGRREINGLLSFSGWAFVTGLTGALMGYADTILVGYFLSNSEIGMYRSSFQLATIALFVMFALRTALYPKIASWMKGGETGAVETALARAITYSLALAVPAAFGAWVLGSSLLYYLYGASFVAAAPALSLLFMVELVTVFLSLETMCLGALDMPKSVFQVTAIGAVSTILLDIMLIPVFGITGAAFALLVGTGIFALAAHYVLKKRIKVRIEKKPVASIIFSSVVMALCVSAYQVIIPITNVFLIAGAVVTGMVIYSLLLVRLDRGIRDEVRDMVTGIGLPWPGRL